MVRGLVTITDFVQLLFDIKGISQLLLTGKAFNKLNIDLPTLPPSLGQPRRAYAR